MPGTPFSSARNASQTIATDDLTGTPIYLGRYSEAEPFLGRTIETELRIVGPDNVETALARYNLACVMAHDGRRDDAIVLMAEAIVAKISSATTFTALLLSEESADVKSNALRSFPSATPY